MITYHHEPTKTHVETETGTVSGKTSWLKMQLRTEHVDTSVTRYDSDTIGSWTSQSIHLQTTDKMYAEVISRDDDFRYVVVKLDTHDTIFVPIEIADAITGAVLAEEVAS